MKFVITLPGGFKAGMDLRCESRLLGSRSDEDSNVEKEQGYPSDGERRFSRPRSRISFIG